MAFSLPQAASVAVNPSQEEMRAWVLEHMPRIQETTFGNLNYTAEITARLARRRSSSRRRRSTRTGSAAPRPRSGRPSRTRTSRTRT